MSVVVKVLVMLWGNDDGSEDWKTAHEGKEIRIEREKK
jgi:hypothetical protein